MYTYGSTATLTCSAVEGLDDDTDILWLREGEVLSEESGRVEVLNVNTSLSMLTLINLTAADGGDYTCQVSSTLGTSVRVTTVFISPYFTIPPEDITGANGTVLNMTCEAEGYPDPVYQWSREDGKLFGEMTTGESSEVLEFSPIQFGDQGTYICNATSGDVSILSNATLSGTTLLCTHC